MTLESYVIKCTDCFLPVVRFGKPTHNPFKTGICKWCKEEWRQVANPIKVEKRKIILPTPLIKVKT